MSPLARQLLARLDALSRPDSDRWPGAVPPDPQAFKDARAFVGWTSSRDRKAQRRRWHLVGNAVSEYPTRTKPGRLSAFATPKWPDLSARALTGFVRRAREGRLRYPDGFLDALERALTSRGEPT